jgi:inner membrane protein
MSSFVGHTITSIGLYTSSKRPEKLTLMTGAWLGWLVFVGLVPDVDYFVPVLYALRSNEGLRITHSIVGCLLLPLLTVVVLSRLGPKKEALRLCSLQVCLVGLSHLIMDALVCVWPLPVLYPFTSQVFKLPFGILPSAPSFQLSNYYMYRNLLIEVGVLLPLYTSIYLIRFSKWAVVWQYSLILLLGICSLGFMYWAYTLAR